MQALSRRESLSAFVKFNIQKQRMAYRKKAGYFALDYIKKYTKEALSGIKLVLPFTKGIFLKQPNANRAHPAPKQS